MRAGLWSTWDRLMTRQGGGLAGGWAAEDRRQAGSGAAGPGLPGTKTWMYRPGRHHGGGQALGPAVGGPAPAWGWAKRSGVIGLLSRLNRPGFDGGSDDTEGSLSWDRRSIPMSCASEPRGWRWTRWLTRRGPRVRSAGSARSWVSTPRLCAPGSRRPRSMVV